MPPQTGQITTVIVYIMTEKPEKGESKSDRQKEAEKKGLVSLGMWINPPRVFLEVKESVLSLMQFTPSESLDFKVVTTPVSTGAENRPAFRSPTPWDLSADVFYQGKTARGLNFHFVWISSSFFMPVKTAI